ncbi:hypothetical protein LUZ16_03190 [Streptomyces albireticuli]|nr:hypothetical protein [Streptomyces albireticuli]
MSIIELCRTVSILDVSAGHAMFKNLDQSPPIENTFEGEFCGTVTKCDKKPVARAALGPVNR